MNTEKGVQWGQRGRYENLEIFMEDARRLRSQVVCGMITSLITRLRGVFGTLVAPFGKTMGPSLPTTGKARPQGSTV